MLRHPGIDALVEAVSAAWAAKDAAAYAASKGLRRHHRGEAIRAQHAFLVSGPFAPSTLTLQMRRTVFLSAIAAMVDVDMTLKGVVGLPLGFRPRNPA